MSKECYVSPLPSEFRPDYSHRGEGWPPLRRVHLFTIHGEVVPCRPSCCRECNRERQCEENHRAS